MRPESLGLLTDIRDAAQHIAEATTGITYEDFLSNQEKRQSILFSFLIIGEAVNRLRRVAPATADRISAVPKIVGLRNSLIHGYRSIDSGTVWRTIWDSLPVLRAEVDALLPEEAE